MLPVDRAAHCLRDPTVLHGGSRQGSAQRQYSPGSATRTHFRSRRRFQHCRALALDSGGVLGDRALVHSLSRRHDDVRLRVRHVDAQLRDLPRNELATHCRVRAAERGNGRRRRLVSLRDCDWIHSSQPFHEGIGKPTARKFSRCRFGESSDGDARQAPRSCAQQHVARPDDDRRRGPRDGRQSPTAQPVPPRSRRRPVWRESARHRAHVDAAQDRRPGSDRARVECAGARRRRDRWGRAVRNTRRPRD